MYFMRGAGNSTRGRKYFLLRRGNISSPRWLCNGGGFITWHRLWLIYVSTIKTLGDEVKNTFNLHHANAGSSLQAPAILFLISFDPILIDGIFFFTIYYIILHYTVTHPIYTIHIYPAGVGLRNCTVTHPIYTIHIYPAGVGLRNCTVTHPIYTIHIISCRRRPT